MKIKTNLLEEYVNIVDNTKEQKTLMDMYNYTCILLDYTYNYTSSYTFIAIM